MKTMRLLGLGSFLSKLSMAVLCVAFAPCLQAQDVDANNNAVAVVPDNVLFKSGGFLYHYQAGQARRIDQDLRISDRVTVRANGSVLKDGNVFTVGDGQMVFPDGRLERTPVGFSPTRTGSP